MKLQRYRDDYSGCEPDVDGEYVRLLDVLELLQKISDNLDDPNVINELEENDLNGSTLVDQYIRRNKEENLVLAN